MTPAPIRASHLRCEYQTNPLGLHESSPRVFWWVDDPRPAARQSAYRIRCASSPDRLPAADLWDSGKVPSSQQAHVPLGVATLKSRQRVYWDVTLWGLDDAPGQPSDAAWFEMGLLNPADWAAQFIATNLFGSGRTSPPVPLLRRTFHLPAPVARARLYITALGLYDAQINGQPVTTDCLRPGWTDYHHRLAYQTYDVTHHLTAGANAIGVMLGDGWYCGRVAHLDRALMYGQQPALLAQLEVHCQDGTRHTITTDSTWTWATGPIDSADLLAGEDYDARKEVPGWASATGPTSSDAPWHPVKVIDRPAAALVASAAPPVRVVQELTPIAEPVALQFEWGRRHHIFDFGQNFAGNVRLSVRGPRGCTLQLRFAEVLSPNGRLDTSNLRSARATDTYTLRGDPAGETYTPRFTFHGFRYAEISYHESFQTPTHYCPVTSRIVSTG